MPYKNPIVCLKCECTESPMWTNAENLGVICFDCMNDAKPDPNLDVKEEEDEIRPVKRKTRSGKKANGNSGPKPSQPKGRGRRSLHKKTPIKAPMSMATTVTSDYVFYKGSYIQIGDIVALKDEDDQVYYAQIKGLMTDQYCKKSAVITWLLPTDESPLPNEEFDPATYIIGPEEDIPRNLEYMEFIMHAPSDYYKSKTTPYPKVNPDEEAGYIWTSLATVKQPNS